MQQLKKAGYDIQVIAKIHDFQNRSAIEDVFKKEGIPMTLTPHLKAPWKLLLKKLPQAFVNIGIFDGAALEYMDPEYQSLVQKMIKEFRPDVIWLEYSTMWPMLEFLQQFNIPLILKSSLNEPKNCIAEHGGSLLSRIKALPKYHGEKVVARTADMVLAITPEEEDWYKSLGAQNTAVLPLRGLSKCLETRTHTQKEGLDVVFLSSNYNMGHNRDALRFLLDEIVPEVRKLLPGKVKFHLTGSKFRESDKKFLADDIVYEGFVDDLGAFLRTMDAAVCPWISGHGMQQKVFEPLCRSIPLLTTKTAGYPFKNSDDVMLCDTASEYAAGLQKLLSAVERNRISHNAYTRSQSLFSEAAVTKVMETAINRALRLPTSGIIGS
jgi:hypothetical protein